MLHPSKKIYCVSKHHTSKKKRKNLHCTRGQRYTKIYDWIPSHVEWFLFMRCSSKFNSLAQNQRSSPTDFFSSKFLPNFFLCPQISKYIYIHWGLWKGTWFSHHYSAEIISQPCQKLKICKLFRVSYRNSEVVEISLPQ